MDRKSSLDERVRVRRKDVISPTVGMRGTFVALEDKETGEIVTIVERYWLFDPHPDLVPRITQRQLHQLKVAIGIVANALFHHQDVLEIMTGMDLTEFARLVNEFKDELYTNVIVTPRDFQ